MTTMIAMTATRQIWLLLWMVAPALGSAEALSVSLNGRAQLGKSLPYVEVQINEPIAGFRLNLKRSDGKTFEFKGGGRPGQARRIELQQPEGKFHYTGQLTAVFPSSETATMSLDFDAELRGPLKLTLEKGEVDIANRKVRVRASRPVVKASVQVLMDTGEYAFDGEVPFSEEDANKPLEITWPQAPGRVMKISIRAYDASTFFDGVEIFPWQVDIPHEEVNFDSGKFELRPGEDEKLHESLVLISDALKKYGHLAHLKLYIAGHTDTVGAQGPNRTLSLNRARAIGAYFKKRGLRIPIFYEGFGEEALLVGTPDETSEAKNRRAEYIIAVEEPVLGRAAFAPNWRKL